MCLVLQNGPKMERTCKESAICEKRRGFKRLTAGEDFATGVKLNTIFNYISIPYCARFMNYRIYNKILDRDWLSARLFVT